MSVKKQYVIYEDEDQQAYDFSNARTIAKRTTVIESTAHLIKGCLGAGLLGIHHGFMKGGLWTSLFMTMFFGMYFGYCIKLLIESAQRLYCRLHIPTLTYSDLAEVSVASSMSQGIRKYSRAFRILVDVVVCLDLFGACACYEIYIGQAVKQLMEDVDKDIKRSIRIYIFLIAIPILLLCMIRALKYLAPFSLIGNFLILLSVGITMYYATRNVPPLSDRPGWRSFTGLAEFTGLAIFSIGGVGVAMPIENNMARPRKFPRVLLSGYSIVTGAVCLTGFVGFWGWGDDCKSSVTLNFPMETLPKMVKFAMAIVIAITFALNFWVPFNIVWHYLGKKYPHETHWFWERIFRALHVCVITCMAAAFPKLTNFMGFIGALSLSQIGFIFPAVIDLIVVWHKPGLGAGKFRLWRNSVIIFLGIIFMCIGTWTNGEKLFAGSVRDDVFY